MSDTITFLHVERHVDKVPYINLMPLGMIALANYISDNGYDVEVIDKGLTFRLNNQFDPSGYLAATERKVVCLDLFWHYQAFSVISEVKRIRQMCPDITIILGGYTASFFAKEIVANFYEVDYVVRGDSEKPLKLLLDNLIHDKGSIDDVPNITYLKKDSEEVVTNGHRYVVDEAVLNQLRWYDFSLLKDYEYYRQVRYNQRNFDEKNFLFYFNCGRGCPVDCAFCGGSCSAQQLISNREIPVHMSFEHALEQLRGAISVGYNTWYTCFDPYPEGDYYIGLFEYIRETGIKISCHFECYGLPRKEFVRAFRKTFPDSYSRLILSPDCGAEKVRDFNKGYSYRNEQLLEIIKECESHSVSLELYFSAGFAGESKADIVETIKLINDIQNKYPTIKIISSPIEMEPASPWSYMADKYGVITERKTFIDYCIVHKNVSSIGYHTDLLSEEEIICALMVMNYAINTKSIPFELDQENKNPDFCNLSEQIPA